jgi:uncharacterized protein involved in tolerance to divalent cations
MIETAFDDKKELAQVVDELLNSKLVVSCQVVESDSKWRWNNELEKSKEYLVFMKTKFDLQDRIHEVISSIHSYDTFEFAVFPFVSCSEDYLKWVDEETI